jgi:phosphonate transport system substrate-binding protein
MRGWIAAVMVGLAAGSTACDGDVPAVAAGSGSASAGDPIGDPVESEDGDGDGDADGEDIAPGPGAPRNQTLRIGLVSQRPATVINQYTALARVLASRSGLEAGEAHAAVDADAMIGRLCSGDVDLMIDTANDAARAREACGATPIAVAAKGGDLRYRSVIFVHTRSTLRSISDLSGRVILFEDSTSTSAYVVPRAMLETAGLTVEPADRAPAVGVTRFRFVDDELNIVGGVVHGRAEAGAVSSNDIEEYLAGGAEIRILAQSDPVPRTIVLAAPGLSPERMQVVTASLLGLDSHPDVLRALRRSRIARFSAFDARDSRALEQIGRAQQPTSPEGGS